MNRKHIDHAALAGNVPPPSDAFVKDTMARLRAMAKEEEKPMKRKLSTSILVAAILIVLLAATALAVGLRRSTEANAMFEARQALGAKYGLTTETLGMFSFDAKQDHGNWIITFSGEAADDEKLGVYTVTIQPGHEAQAVWSHDDVDPSLWADGSLEAPVWGQAQIMQALLKNTAELASYSEIDWTDTSFEAMAERSGSLFLLDAKGETESYRYLLPDSEDLAPELALDIARRELMDAYGVDAAVLDEYTELIFFVEPRKGGARQFIVQYTRLLSEEDSFAVQIASPSAEVLQVRWTVPNSVRTLPDGPLDDYRHAVQEFMETGALAAQSAACKGDIVKRVKDAGWEDIIQPTLAYVAPTAQDIAEEAALSAAKKALVEAFAFNDKTTALFETITSLVDMHGERRWIIEFHPAKCKDWNLDDAREKMGNYAVTLDAQNGDVLEAVWDLSDTWTEEGYTQNTWASAPAYHGKLLPWLMDLAEEIHAIADRYPEDAIFYDYTEEDAAAYDTFFRNAGFSAKQFRLSLPGPNDLTKSQALAIAREALLSEMQVPEAVLESAGILAEYTVSDPEIPTWGVSFQFIHEGIFVDFGVSIDARTGEVLYTNSITGAKG